MKFFKNKVLLYSLLETWIGRKKKLVRDKIPEQLAEKKKHLKFFEVDDEKYLFFLKRKLVEEVNEVIDALENSNEEHQQEEIGDVLEVLDAMMHFKKFAKEEVLKKKEEKRLKKGGFYKKVILHED